MCDEQLVESKRNDEFSAYESFNVAYMLICTYIFTIFYVLTCIFKALDFTLCEMYGIYNITCLRTLIHEYW